MSRNRLLLLAGAVGAAAVVAVLLIAIGAGSDAKNARATATATTSRAGAQETSFLAGVPQHGDTLGSASAPATLTVYEDPQCPFCRDWALETLPAVVADYVKPGRLKLAYRGIQIIGPNSEPGLRAIYAAGKQNKLWNLADALYRRQGAENSGWITAAVINEAAASAGADAGAIRAAAATAAVTAELRGAARQAMADRVRGTPTFVLQHAPALPRQLQVSGLDAATFESELAAALQ